MTHEQILDEANRKVDVKLMKHEREFQELRGVLVEKYGEEGIKKVEDKACNF